MTFDPPLTVQEVATLFSSAYSHVTVLASGGQGAVFLAQSVTVPELRVALKFYFADQVEERAQREVDALRRIECGALVRLVDAGACSLRGQSCFYVATEFIEGENLAAVVRRGEMDASAVARIGYDIAGAVDALWKDRIVHRDIKPANILLRASGDAVLIDLGVARHLSLPAITTPGSTWGTRGYLAPEHARAGPVTCKSDIFSLGIVLQEALTGRHPTGGRQPELMDGGPRTLALRADVPPDLAIVIDRMVHRQAHQRPMPAQVAALLAHHS